MTEQEQSLLDIYRQLSEHDAHSLIRFAEFLAGYEVATAKIVDQANQDLIETAEVEVGDDQTSTSADSIPLPEKIERPEQERVVDALKRLSATYPMLDKKHLLDKASELVAQHVMFGKPAKQVIDEVEEVFSQAYAKFADEARRN